MPHRTQDDSRFLAARSEWDNRFGDLAKGRRNWQIAAMLFAALALVSTVAAALLALRSEVQVMLIKENELGELAAWGSPEQLLDPSHRHYVAELGKFIRAARSISTDPEAQKVWIEQTYAYVTRGAARFLNTYYQDNNPYETGRRRTAAVTIRSVAPISENTWQIRWDEDTKDLSGRTIRDESWQAIVSTVIRAPESLEAVSLNPSNIYLTSIHWTPEAGKR